MFSKKATKIEEIFTVDLTLCSKCQIDDGDFVNFCGILRRHELYAQWGETLLIGAFTSVSVRKAFLRFYKLLMLLKNRIKFGGQLVILVSLFLIIWKLFKLVYIYDLKINNVRLKQE